MFPRRCDFGSSCQGHCCSNNASQLFETAWEPVFRVVRTVYFQSTGHLRRAGREEDDARSAAGTGSHRVPQVQSISPRPVPEEVMFTAQASVWRRLLARWTTQTCVRNSIAECIGAGESQSHRAPSKRAPHQGGAKSWFKVACNLPIRHTWRPRWGFGGF